MADLKLANPLRLVFSFDRDHTLAPWAGPIPMEALRRLKERGAVIGTGGGASGEEQAQQWRQQGVVPDFAFTKEELGRLKELYPHTPIVHVGDTEDDRAVAEKNGFDYLAPREFLLMFGG